MTCQLRPHKLAPKENTNCLLYYDDSVVLCPAALGIGNRLHTGKSVCSTFEGATALAQDRHISDQARQRHSRHSHGLGGVSAGPCSHVFADISSSRDRPRARCGARAPSGGARWAAAGQAQEPCGRAGPRGSHVGLWCGVRSRRWAAASGDCWGCGGFTLCRCELMNSAKAPALEF